MVKKVDGKELANKGKGFITEFKDFVLKGNVVDMAIGVIIGTAFAGIVNAFTSDFINPVIGLLGGADVAGEVVIKTLSDGTKISLNYGHFITQIINFIIMAFVLFLILKIFNKIVESGKKRLVKEKEEAAAKSDEVVLLEEIRDLLKKQNKK
ncbi:MAG: large conductance mechanosensitive channel protein MscL [Bacilli bacterium]|nr:large conductance mechanosensitive channel protein MscL [Bacilli bacterium]